VVCAYLRMPYAPALERPGPDAAHDEHERYERNIQERQVRLTAQRILHRHLLPDAKNPWTTQRIDLTGAELTGVDLTEVLWSPVES